MENIKLTDWIIAISTAINVIVYFFLWLTTKESIKEMKKNSEFFFVAEVTKQWIESRRSDLLKKNFPEMTKKYELV